MYKVIAAVSLACTLLPVGVAQSREPGWVNISRGDLCVTEGAVEQASGERLSVDVPKMRAYANLATSPSAEIRFSYAGGTKNESALGSGQMRRQFGLKMRAQDPCNLVYVMWRIDPEPKLVVSVKRNPADHTSAQCGNRGYTNIKRRKSSPVPCLQPGESHTLRAEMQGDELRVFVDNREVWEGSVGADAASLEGPVGIRSDNVRFEFELKARKSNGTSGDHANPCKAGDSD
jgi:hypothetical protein